MVHIHNHKKRCPKCDAELEVEESKKRSMAKSISFRVVEIAIAIVVMYFAILFGTMIGLNPLELATLLVLAEEGTCFFLFYVWERLWNRIGWGRRIVGKNR